MKKIIIFSMVLILGLSLMVFAKGALKVDFYAGPDWDDCIEGFVIVNSVPSAANIIL